MNNTVLKNLIISMITGIIHASLGVLLFYFEPVTKLIDFFASDYISIELYVELILLIATFVIVMHKLGFEKNFYMSLAFLFFSGAVSLILTNGIANLLSNPFDRLGCLVILIGVAFCAAINACLMLLIYLYTVLRRKLSKKAYKCVISCIYHVASKLFLAPASFVSHDLINLFKRGKSDEYKTFIMPWLCYYDLNDRMWKH